MYSLVQRHEVNEYLQECTGWYGNRGEAAEWDQYFKGIYLWIWKNEEEWEFSGLVAIHWLLIWENKKMNAFLWSYV